MKTHSLVYMAQWSAMEMKMANDSLELGLTDAAIETRMAIFGGAARYVLVDDDEFVKRGRQELEAGLSAINSISDVRACFEKQMDLAKIVHRLLYYYVNPEDWTEAHIKPASKVVAALIHDKLNRKLHD